ncbi:MAG TPA: CRISPR-associated endonuclease Cas2 [Candidatus Paceibacterota bacterium]
MKKGLAQNDFLSEVRESKDRLRRGAVIQTTLEIVGVTGFIATALLAPNVLGVLYKNNESKQKRWNVWKSIKQLEHDGLLKRTGSGSHSRFELTAKGRLRVAEYEIGKIKIRKPWRWDSKWRLVIFDISESKRDSRDELRSTLASLGFQKLQQSVWVYPYHCVDVINLLKRKHRLTGEVLYLEVDMLENDQWLRDVFSLN